MTKRRHQNRPPTRPARALHNLEIGVDNHGHTFLVGIAGPEGDQIVLVSVTLAAVED